MSLSCKYSRKGMHLGPVHTMPDKFENGTLTMKMKQKFSVHNMKTGKMFCVRSPYELLSASTLQRSEASKTLKRTFVHAHIGALSQPYLDVVTLLLTRKRLLSFLIYLACQAAGRKLRKKKTKPNTFHGLMTR